MLTITSFLAEANAGARKLPANALIRVYDAAFAALELLIFAKALLVHTNGRSIQALGCMLQHMLSLS